MTEQNQQTQATGAAITGESTGQPAAETQQRTYTDADIAKARRKAEKERDEAVSELAKMREAAKTADEKARDELIRSTREETERTLRAEMLQKDIRHEIRIRLAEKQVPANQVSVVIDQSKPENIEDALAAADKYADWWVKNVNSGRPSGQPGSPTAPVADQYAGPFTATRIAELRELRANGKISTADWAKVSANIQDAIRTKSISG